MRKGGQLSPAKEPRKRSANWLRSVTLSLPIRWIQLFQLDNLLCSNVPPTSHNEHEKPKVT